MEKLAKLRQQFSSLGIDGIVITNPQNRRYMTNFTGTAGTVLISEKEAILIVDFRYVEQGHTQAENYHIVKQSNSAIESVASLVSEMGITKLGFEQNHMTYEIFHNYQDDVKTELVPTSNVVENLRMIKNEREITLLREAGKIADAAFKHITNYIKPGLTELDVNHELEAYMRQQGATSSSFDTIVASGYRSAMPHGVASEKVIEKGDMVTLDFGALYKGYRSDMTRTVAVGEPAEELKNIYQIVLEALKLGSESVRPGTLCQDVDQVTRQFITEKGYGKNFGHGTGHAIGLDIHENPFFSAKSEDSLAPGMVMTVEPGIYLPDIGGVRIEDDLLVTEDGHERLIHSPKDLIIL